MKVIFLQWKTDFTDLWQINDGLSVLFFNIINILNENIP